MKIRKLKQEEMGSFFSLGNKINLLIDSHNEREEIPLETPLGKVNSPKCDHNWIDWYKEGEIEKIVCSKCRIEKPPEKWEPEEDLKEILKELIIMVKNQKVRWSHMPPEFFINRRKKIIEVAVNKIKQILK